MQREKTDCNIERVTTEEYNKYAYDIAIGDAVDGANEATSDLEHPRPLPIEY